MTINRKDMDNIGMSIARFSALSSRREFLDRSLTEIDNFPLAFDVKSVISEGQERFALKSEMFDIEIQIVINECGEADKMSLALIEDLRLLKQLKDLYALRSISNEDYVFHYESVSERIDSLKDNNLKILLRDIFRKYFKMYDTSATYDNEIIFHMPGRQVMIGGEGVYYEINSKTIKSPPLVRLLDFFSMCKEGDRVDNTYIISQLYNSQSNPVSSLHSNLFRLRNELVSTGIAIITEYRSTYWKYDDTVQTQESGTIFQI